MTPPLFLVVFWINNGNYVTSDQMEFATKEEALELQAHTGGTLFERESESSPWKRVTE